MSCDLMQGAFLNQMISVIVCLLSFRLHLEYDVTSLTGELDGAIRTSWDVVSAPGYFVHSKEGFQHFGSQLRAGLSPSLSILTSEFCLVSYF